jgi:hypothetical protein
MKNLRVYNNNILAKHKPTLTKHYNELLYHYHL